MATSTLDEILSQPHVWRDVQVLVDKDRIRLQVFPTVTRHFSSSQRPFGPYRDFPIWNAFRHICAPEGRLLKLPTFVTGVKRRCSGSG